MQTYRYRFDMLNRWGQREGVLRIEFEADNTLDAQSKSNHIAARLTVDGNEFRPVFIDRQ
jgi:hypothetical protein